jgi:D-beta-D-heptose 7-phosphate kinase/D-beta-D-heptose 1-phosphate adenosyltransferase
MGCVDAVVIFDEDTPEQMLKRIRPDVLVKGGDYTLSKVAGREYAGEVRLVRYMEGYSTTALINKIITNEEAAT